MAAQYTRILPQHKAAVARGKIRREGGADCPIGVVRFHRQGRRRDREIAADVVNVVFRGAQAADGDHVIAHIAVLRGRRAKNRLAPEHARIIAGQKARIGD